MAVVIGSARHDELGNYRNGKSGDQLQKFKNDFNGEVSMQYLKDFTGSRQWYVLRPRNAVHAMKMAEAMLVACNNVNIGYDQYNRLAIMTYGINSSQPTECDCSSLIRACIKYAVGVSVPNFTTENECEVLGRTGLFLDPIPYKVGMEIFEGDVFCTKKKGHTGCAVDGKKRTVAKQKYIYKGIDYARVFNPTYYANANADVRQALGTNDKVLFNHFILFGQNEDARVGKTIEGFNVLVYGSHAPDLIKTFGECKEGNYAPFYKHYCQFGYKENRRVI